MNDLLEVIRLSIAMDIIPEIIQSDFEPILTVLAGDQSCGRRFSSFVECDVMERLLSAYTSFKYSEKELDSAMDVYKTFLRAEIASAQA